MLHFQQWDILQQQQQQMAADHYTYHRAADHFHRSSSAQCVPMEQKIIRQNGNDAFLHMLAAAAVDQLACPHRVHVSENQFNI